MQGHVSCVSRCSKHPPAADELTQLTQLRASCCFKHCKQHCCSVPEHRGSGYAQGQNCSSVPEDIYPLGWEVWVSAIVEPGLSDQWIFSKLPYLDQDLSLLTSRGIFRLVGKSQLCQDPWKALGLGECKGKGDGICLVRGLTAVLSAQIYSTLMRVSYLTELQLCLTAVLFKKPMC